jgi:ribosomal protein S18 acetylase RimI-like enzyme
MGITIVEVTSKKQLKQFVAFPLSLYKEHPYFVPPLNFDELNTLQEKVNPAFDHCEARYWLAYKNNEIVGRIAGIYNKAYEAKWKRSYMRFGWIDFIEDIEVVRALMNTVEAWAKEKNLTAVHGPLGFTDLDYEGMLVEGFEERGTMATIYNYPYYPELMQELGYVKDVDWVEYRVNVPAQTPEYINKIAELVKKRYQLNIVQLKSAKDILPYAKDIFRLVNETYSELYGVVELTDKQAAYYTKMYFSMVKKDFVTLITDKQNKLIGFGLTMPSLSAALQKAKGSLFPFGFIHLLKALKKNDEADMYLVAIDKEYQGKGVNALLMQQTNIAFNKFGIQYAETNPELEINEKVQSIWEHYVARRHKRRRCFIKQLQ